MVYKLRVVSDEVDDFRRDLLIDSEATFLELKDVICESTGFDPKELSAFYICNDKWEKGTEITLEDMGADMTHDLYLMEETHLSDIIDGEGQKILYTFDLLGDRSLYLQVKEEEFGKDLLNAECVFSRGEAPKQTLPLDEIDIMTNAKLGSSTEIDLDADFLGSNEYDEDELQDYDELKY